MLPETKEQLKKTSTATIATILFKLGLRNQFIQEVRPVETGKPTMVGEAFTLRYIPAREDLNPITVFRDPEHPQRVAIETCPPGAVLVMDSRKSATDARQVLRFANLRDQHILTDLVLFCTKPDARQYK